MNMEEKDFKSATDVVKYWYKCFDNKISCNNCPLDKPVLNERISLCSIVEKSIFLCEETLGDLVFRRI